MGRETMTDEERQAAGLEMRRKVLGEAAVANAGKTRDGFSGEIQDYILRQVWGIGMDETRPRPQDALLHGALHHDGARQMG